MRGMILASALVAIAMSAPSQSTTFEIGSDRVNGGDSIPPYLNLGAPKVAILREDDFRVALLEAEEEPNTGLVPARASPNRRAFRGSGRYGPKNLPRT